MNRKLTALLVTLVVGVGLTGCATPSTSGAQANPTQAADTAHPVTVTVGVTDAGKDYWQTFVKLAKAQGITVELKNFTDYQQPNPILSQGGLNLNQFQHLLFLANYDVSAKADLVPIGATAIYQLGLYTVKGYASPADIPAGGEIAIPNDATNQARALLVLQSAGLVTLKNGGSALSTPADIDASASRVKVVPVDANQTAVQLKSLDGAVINNNYASDANIDPNTAIYSDLKDTKAAEPYINVWAARKADADNPTYKKLIDIYHDPSVTAALLAESKGTAVSQSQSAAELQVILTKLEDQIRAKA